MGYKLKRSVVIMLAFIMTFMVSGVLTTYASDMSNYQFAARVIDSNDVGVDGVTVKAYVTINGEKTQVVDSKWDMSTFSNQDVPVALTSSNGEVTWSYSYMKPEFCNQEIKFEVEDEVYESDDVHTLVLNTSNIPTTVNSESFDWENPPNLAFVVKEKGAASTEHSITFNANGGTVETASAETVDGKLESLPTPIHTNENMVFLGWFTESQGGEPVTLETSFDTDTEIYAHWADASTWNEDDFTYSNDNTTLTGLSDIGKAKLKVNSELVLPDTHDGVDVTAIGDGSNSVGALDGTDDIPKLGTFGFKENSTVFFPTKVHFPTNLKSIGQFAFASPATNNKTEPKEQIGLLELTLPESLETIEMGAFQRIPVEEIVIPDNVETLGQGIFAGSEGATKKIKKVVFPKEPKFSTIANGMFTDQRIESVVIPEGVTLIGDNAFSGCMIKHLSLPKSLTSIGKQAFGNHQLKELDIPGSVESIGNYAFRVNNETYSNTLEKLILHEGLTSIGNASFGRSALKNVDIPTTLTTISKNSFASNDSGIDDKKVLLIVINDTQFENDNFKNGSGHKVSVDVSFDANGGEEIDPPSAKTKLGLVLSEEDLKDAKNSDAAKEFIGWFTERDGGEAVDASKVYEKNTTLYAHWKDYKDEAETADKSAEDAVKVAGEAKKAAEEAKKEADTAKAEADKAAATPGEAAVAAAKKSEEAAQKAATAAADAKDAADKAKAAADEAKAASDAYNAQINKEGSTATDDEKTAAAAMQSKAAERAKNATASATEAAKAKDDAYKALADAKDAVAKAQAAATQSITSVTVNAKTVNAKSINAAITAAGASEQHINTIVLGKSVKKISKSAFKNYKSVRTLEVKTKKLKKKSVKGSLKGSSISKVKVKIGKVKTNKKYVKKYKKFFTKKNAGKKAKVTR